MWRPSPVELAVVLGIVLIIFGPGKLPEVGKALGRALGEFKRNVAPDGEE